jgi:hypothetical protein
MKKIFLPCMAALLLILAGCSSVVQPTVTPIPTFTFTPQPTVKATSTVTPAPTDTPLPPTNTPDVIAALLPKGQPATKWSAIPIMPGAIAGDGDAGSYRFTIQASREDVQNYYEKELSRLGWNFLATGEGDSGAVILIFTGNGGTLSVSMIPNGDQFIVMFVK